MEGLSVIHSLPISRAVQSFDLMPLAPGTRLGPYEITAPLGAGGMGEVYKARDTRLNRIVAIKVSNEQFSERFEREAHAVAALNHSNVCTLHDVGPNYLVMEYIEGTPLKGPLPLHQALKYAAQICDALDAAHRKGITHRDLKPANILVTKSGIKLLDFGLAKIGQRNNPPSDATLTMALTGKNEIVGTLYYMSPEQLQSQATGQEIDARSDIFSFGLVLYEMLTGKRAFDGSSPATVIAAIMERPAPVDWRRCAASIRSSTEAVFREGSREPLAERTRPENRAGVDRASTQRRKRPTEFHRTAPAVALDCGGSAGPRRGQCILDCISLHAACGTETAGAPGGGSGSRCLFKRVGRVRHHSFVRRHAYCLPFPEPPFHPQARPTECHRTGRSRQARPAPSFLPMVNGLALSREES